MSCKSRHVLLAMAGISLVSCSDSTVVEPPPVGTYVLATIAGQSLPANIIAAPAGLVFLTQADTIVLSDDGTARKREVGERVSGSGAPPGPYRTDERLRFTLTDAGVIELTYPCEGAALRADALVSSSAAAPETPRTLSCVAGPHFRGRVTADELVLTESNVGRRVPLRYRRVR